MGWVKHRGILVHDGTFSEPTDDDLGPYRYSAVPVEERQRPTCGSPHGDRHHIRAGEPVCRPCTLARNAYRRDKRQEGKAA